MWQFHQLHFKCCFDLLAFAFFYTSTWRNLHVRSVCGGVSLAYNSHVGMLWKTGKELLVSLV